MEENFVLQISTLFHRTDFINDERFPVKLEILPMTDNNTYDTWNLKNLSLLLNELTNFTVASHPISKKTAQMTTKVTFYFKCDDDISYQIFVTISDKITVKVATNYIKNHWLKEQKDMITNLGAQNHILKNYKIQNFTKFYKLFLNVSKSSSFFIQNESLLYFSKFDFSKIFHFFSKRVALLGLPHNDDTEFIYTYINSFVKSMQQSIQSIDDLVGLGMRGYLKLLIQKKTTRKRLQIITYEEEDYYIIGGVFIVPQAQSFLESYPVSGYIMDTTWKALPHYVTSIITACLKNTSLPIGFSFGHSETAYSYDLLLKTIHNETGISFNETIMESDQGSALRSICTSYSMKHLACLRHFLANLKKISYSYELSQIVSCSSEVDLHNCIQLFSEKFLKIISEEPDEISTINKSLKKIGLQYEDGEINIIDSVRWEEVSMYKRIDYNMPSTTNTLEAMHGHINHRVPRNNGFYQSIFRLNNEINQKYININNRIQHNLNSLKTRTLNKLKKLSMFDLLHQITFYETTVNKCNCGQNKLESSNYQLDIPCMHRLYLGAVFPTFEPININTELQYDSIKLDIDVIPIEENNSESDCMQDEKEYAFRTIRFFSLYKNEEKIREYVNSHHKSFAERDGFYIRNQEISVIQLIENGISFFKELKANPTQENNELQENTN